MKKALLKSVLVGYLGSLSLWGSITFPFLPFGRDVSPITIGLVGGLISSILYVLLAWNVKKNTEMVCYSLVGCISFAVFMVIDTAIRISVPNVFGILRKSDSADGILLLFVIGTFAVVSILLDLCSFIVLIVRNRIQQHRVEHRTGDGSLS